MRIYVCYEHRKLERVRAKKKRARDAINTKNLFKINETKYKRSNIIRSYF